MSDVCYIDIREFLDNGCWIDYVVAVPNELQELEDIFNYIAKKIGHRNFELKIWDEEGYYAPYRAPYRPEINV